MLWFKALLIPGPALSPLDVAIRLRDLRLVRGTMFIRTGFETRFMCRDRAAEPGLLDNGVPDVGDRVVEALKQLVPERPITCHERFLSAWLQAE